MKYIYFALIISILALACSSNPFTNSQTPTSTAYGEPNHIVLVCNQSDWDGAIGDSLRYYFGSSYPILPQPEAIFDIRQMNYSDIVALKTFRELRNYIFIADLSKKDTLTYKLLVQLLGTERINDHLQESPTSNLISRDVWAHGQQLMYILGNDQDDLFNRIRRSFPGISRQIREFDRPRIRGTVYAAGVSKLNSESIGDRYHISIELPYDWKLVSSQPAGSWIRKETEKASFNLILSKIKYENTNQFSEDGFKKIRDTLLRHFVTTDSPGDFMKINDIDLPLFTYQKNIDGNYGIEMRGVWETAIEFMGGPFQTYMIQTPKKDSILFIDAFVYAPEQEKRDLIQQLEEVIQTVHFK